MKDSPSGQSQLKGLYHVWKTTGRKPQPLAEMPKLPRDMRYIWETYHDMATSEVLTHVEINAWEEGHGIFLSLWVRETLKLLDKVRFGVVYE